jgi:hypothetical protein
MNEVAGSAPVSRQRLDEFAVFEYRTAVMSRLDVTAEWRGLDWTDQASCADQLDSTPTACGRCPVAAECLAASVTTDDHAQWRGGLSRADREQLWTALERTYREIRDLELMRMDPSQLSRRGDVHRISDRAPKWSRS